MNRPTVRQTGRQSSTLQRVIIGLASGMAAYLIMTLLKQPQIWVITVSTFVGGTALLIRFLIGIERAVNEGFERVNRATQILASVEESALPSDKILKLVEGASKHGPTTAPAILEFIGKQLDSTAELLDGLSRGEATYAGEDRNWLLWLTTSAETTLDAMSPAINVSAEPSTLSEPASSPRSGGTDFLDGFWTSDLGQRYLDAQNMASDRQVRVRRIFLLVFPALADDPAFRQMCRDQADLGIDVRILPNPQTLHDWVIFDGRITYEVTPESRPFGKAPLMTTRVSILPARLRERERIFESLWEKAEPISDYGPSLPNE